LPYPEAKDRRGGRAPTPGVMPATTPEAKTLKMGLLTCLSGPGATWGLEELEGMEFAAGKINGAGGINVVDDKY